MARRLIHNGFKVVPLMGILDEETDRVIPAQGSPMDLPPIPGALAQFENKWYAESFQQLKEEFAQGEMQRAESLVELEEPAEVDEET